MNDILDDDDDDIISSYLLYFIIAIVTCAGTSYPSTLVIAAGAYIPEETFGSLDLNMPSYTVDRNVDLLGGATTGSSTGSGSTTKKGGVDRPADKAQARNKQAAEKARKVQEVQEKMQAKKAERAKIQQAGRTAAELTE